MIVSIFLVKIPWFSAPRFGPGTQQPPRAEALAGRGELGELGEGSDRGALHGDRLGDGDDGW